MEVPGAEASVPSYKHCPEKSNPLYTSYNKNLKAKQIQIKFCALLPNKLLKRLLNFIENSIT